MAALRTFLSAANRPLPAGLCEAINVKNRGHCVHFQLQAQRKSRSPGGEGPCVPSSPMRVCFRLREGQAAEGAEKWLLLEVWQIINNQ